MPTGKNTPFNVTILALLLCITLFAQSPQARAAFVFSPWQNHLWCHFFHANLWHWAANALALYLMRPSPTDMLKAFPVAALATWCTPTPTIGFSALMYAYIGMNIIRWRVSILDWAVFIIANLLTIFMPGIAFSVHLIAFIVGMTVNYLFSHSSLKK